MLTNAPCATSISGELHRPRCANARHRRLRGGDQANRNPATPRLTPSNTRKAAVPAQLLTTEKHHGIAIRSAWLMSCIVDGERLPSGSVSSSW